jgi:hypothetical protein
MEIKKGVKYLNQSFLIGFKSTDGHNEAEFGMSWCAGFGDSFYHSYFEVIFHK